jgi:predicted phosphohydrolase
MKLAWASDVHFEFVEEEDLARWCARVKEAGAQALLLGGDIAVATTVADLVADVARQVDCPVYFVLGNHDYYRGSVPVVRDAAAALAPPAHWLPACGPQTLASDLGLVGQGGWGDTRVGDFMNSPVMLNDYLLIEELAAAQNEKEPLRQLLRDYGSQAAEDLRPHLWAAAERFPRVLVLTHVPPWRAACWHEGNTSNDDWAPGFVCGAVGETISAAALAHPHVEWTVFCGHTHSPGTAHLAPNLTAHTLGAEYGQPEFVTFDSEDLAGFSPLGVPARG